MILANSPIDSVARSPENAHWTLIHLTITVPAPRAEALASLSLLLAQMLETPDNEVHKSAIRIIRAATECGEEAQRLVNEQPTD